MIDQQGGGFRPGSFVGEAEAALDALLDYLEERQSQRMSFGRVLVVPVGHAYVSELVALLREEAANG